MMLLVMVNLVLIPGTCSLGNTIKSFFFQLSFFQHILTLFSSVVRCGHHWLCWADARGRLQRVLLDREWELPRLWCQSGSYSHPRWIMSNMCYVTLGILLFQNWATVIIAVETAKNSFEIKFFKLNGLQYFGFWLIFHRVIQVFREWLSAVSYCAD